MSRKATNARDKDAMEPGWPSPAPAIPPLLERSPDHPPPPAEPTAAWPGPAPTSDQIAAQFREAAGSAFFYLSMVSVFPVVDTYAFKTFRDRLLADCGGPTDPIEVMLIEQITLAHLNIGRLQFRSASADSVEAAKVYGGLATQLTAEFRRTCLALQAYRLAARHAGGGAAGPALPGAATAPPPARENAVDSELVSKEANDHGSGTVPFAADESEAGGRRQGERVEASRAIA